MALEVHALLLLLLLIVGEVISSGWVGVVAATMLVLVTRDARAQGGDIGERTILA